MQDKIITFVKNLGEFATKTEKNLVIFTTPNSAGKIFLILHTKNSPFRLEVGTDPKLAKLLVERYESVMPSKNISPNEWIEIICSGQLEEAEILDLIRMSFNRANNVLT
ncbi:MAG: MmcQ/YjbR family DNA-binding protein [Candidatus Nomurabacteria bacterium]|jgi:predicted DNA-binding protein (MmcQ/YjbR family)|nr:MmcQ/YjbR family DNA-binding protein [Candidatus Nomurabacteria bacterium]